MRDPADRSRRPATRFGAFALVLSLYLLFIDRFDVVEAVGFQLGRRDAADPLLRGLLTAALYATGLFGLAATAVHRWLPVRVLAWMVIAGCAATAEGWRGVDATGFTLHAARLLWSEADYTSEALGFFFGRYAGPAALATAMAAALCWISWRHVPRVRPAWVCLVPFAVTLASGVLLRVTTAKVEEFPTPYRVPLLIEYAYSHQSLFYGERDAPYLTPRASSDAAAVPHILFVMDESVSGDLLGINGGPADTTPFLASLGPRLVNFGVVPSISNRSSISNIVVQSGVLAEQLPDEELRSLKNPNVFSYMRRAGYRSFYVDVQTYGPPSNYLTRFDVDALDGFLQILPTEVGAEEYDLDFRATDRIVKLIRESDRSFVYLLKAGAHIHYEGRYPEPERHFAPTLRAGELDDLNFDGADRTRTLNSYLNALRWNVDGFWRDLLEKLESTGKPVLIVYTSDHGQSLLEVDPGTGRPETLSHNRREDPAIFQAMVPLFAVGVGAADDWLRGRFDASSAAAVDQFSLFPTLLVAAGYDEREVALRYGPTIFDPLANRASRRFVSGDLFDPQWFRWNEFRRIARPLGTPE